MIQLKTFILVCVSAMTVTFVAQSHAASFDCAKAATLVENVICTDSEISAQDDALLVAYRQALTNAGKTDALKHDQQRWLKKRNLCKNKTCLQQLYEQRIKVLSHLNPLPQTVGHCIDSKIIGKQTRFDDAVAGEAGGEVVVALPEVGLYIQSVAHLSDSVNLDKYMYSTADFSKGDKVKLCLEALPENCPAGDDRGKTLNPVANPSTNIKPLPALSRLPNTAKLPCFKVFPSFLG
jgi:uncharacterized protein